jgi:hypothetical protein
MRFVLAGTLTIVILGILTLATNYSIAQTANVTAGFIANRSNSNNTDLRSTDPNYNIYPNLALGFSIKYLKNMTITQTQNSSGNTLIHAVTIRIPLGKPFKEHLSMKISVIPETNFLGQQYSLDQTVRNDLMNYLSGNDTVVTNKTKGILNGFPAYKIESTMLVSKVFKNITSSLGFDGKPITHQYQTSYVTFRNGIGYCIAFLTFSPNRFNSVEKTMLDSFRYN